MRSIVSILVPLFLACATTTASGDRVFRRPVPANLAVGADVALEASLQNGVLVQGADGQTYLGVWIAAPELRGAADRPPMAMSLVIDRSGSMEGDKIINARTAAQSFISRMRDGDILSVFAYDDEVMQVFGPAALTPAARELATSRIMGLQPGGSTNIYGGLVAAQNALQSTPRTHPLRRMILLSDGLANVGPSSPEELGQVGARGTDLGIQITTIGVGLSYDERLMLTVAMRSAGRFYHLAEPGQMAQILTQELDLMSRTVASATMLEVIPAPGIQILGAEGIEIQRQGERVLLPLGTLYSTQRREVLLRVKADTRALGERALGQVRLRYSDAEGQNERTSAVQVAYRVGSAAESTRSHSDRVETMVQGYLAVAAQRQAAELLNRGDSAGASVALQQQASDLRRAAAPMAAPARAEVERRARRLEEQSVRAGRASAPAASRGAALDLADDAAEASGY